MELTILEQRVLAAIEDGLPLAARPYEAVARAVASTETEVVAVLDRLISRGVVSRFGVVVRHRELGYRANAMVVWDVPDGQVGDAGRALAELPFVTLCYRRPRRPPDWPYNLFCMIHGRDRAAVRSLVDTATATAGLEAAPRAVLFSRRRFKQRGARYWSGGPGAALEGDVR